MHPRSIDLHTSNPNPWPIIGGPSPGTVAALAVGLGDGYTVFAGARTGLHRTNAVAKGVQAQWQKLPSAPLEIIALGVSPNYAADTTLFAGTGQGLFVSRDGGDQWQVASTPMPAPVILSLAFSPNYAADGIILASALEDGIYHSDSRGERWSYRGFGLLDAAVYTLAISPNFAHDETLFAGTESALYYSYNGARAWKLLDFPEEAAPILSLALSSRFAQEQTIYAGTERHGLYRSIDLGKSWQKLDLPATCVNALVMAPEDGCLFAATNAGLYASSNAGERWVCLLDQPDAFSLALRDNLLIAGVVNQGAWLTSDRMNWQPFFTLPARSLTGMALSPHFDTDPVGFLYGPHEGIWRTLDGGLSWSCLNDSLPNLDIHMMALSPRFLQERLLLAATAEGLLMSEDAGDQWSLLIATPAAHIAFAPSGGFIAAAFTSGEIQVAQLLKGPWQSVPAPGGKHNQVLALAIDDQAMLRVALLDQAQASVCIWEGKPGQFTRILTQPASPNPIVRFCGVPDGASGSAWYASLDHQVWEFRRPPREGPASANLIFEVADESKILTLTGSQPQSGSALFACTSQTIYQATSANEWRAIHNFGDERAVALALSPAYPDDATAFALLLGGSFCRGSVPSL